MSYSQDKVTSHSGVGCPEWNIEVKEGTGIGRDGGIVLSAIRLVWSIAADWDD
jgi:hypothetical protein